MTLYGEDSRALTFEKSCQSALACGVSSYDMHVSSSSYDLTCMYPPPPNLVSLHWHAGTASVLAVVQDPRAVHTGRFAAYRYGERLEDEGSMEGEGDQQWPRAKILKSTPYSGFV